MKTIARLAVLVAAVLVSMAAAPNPRIKALIIDGQHNHNWQVTTAFLKRTLLDTGRFAVDVSTTPGEQSPQAEWGGWWPAFENYRVVVLNYNGGSWPAEVQESFTKYVSGGGGVFVIHGANNAFKGWKDYDLMIGLGGRRDKDDGNRLTFDDQGELVRTPKGEGWQKAGHGTPHSFIVTARTPDHPIIKGLPVKWLHAKDELYHGQRGPALNMTILNSAYDAVSMKGTGAHEPMTWVIPFGKGKVVTTVMGHHMGDSPEVPALQCIGFQTIVARASEWVATGVVTVPIPSNFPTAETISTGPALTK